MFVVVAVVEADTFCLFSFVVYFEIWGLCLGFLYACPCRADPGWVPVMAFLGFGWDLDG